MTYPIYNDLNGKTVFITGGGSGIGASFVSAFAQQGAQVAFVSLSTDPAELVCDTVENNTGHRPLYIQCDIRNINALQAAINQARDAFGPIDILINNAARDDRHSVENYTADAWDSAMDTNLRPHFFTAQACLNDMQKNGGSIINLGSNSAILGLAGYASYVTAKAGIIGLTKALARELGPSNIRVNALIPGWVLTERQKELWATPETVKECLSQQSLKKTITEDDVSNAALFLASNASAMVTGQSLIVDGGRV
ncbi:SDR family NAD(P)-dependent oxidoreductase [Kordiimonas aquimaris]|uniref:SDR family NAD(P)-dependent oxidoreductase n=1 Tax=Kordiimonas aquimaris TaxID=707591 RepID=UPI0021D0E4A2|nr:SDR family oxidoreductase [Kordiimonas aquimaris]